MYKLLMCSLLMLAITAHAQDKKSLDSVDKVIIQAIIQPAEQQAATNEPAWAAIGQQIRMTYSETQADRALTKAKIYYYYGKNWPHFSTALVHYTETYEDKYDFPLMNKNANFVLTYSANPREWQAAQAWVKTAVDKEPGNSAYKTTYDSLTARINGH
ncbi:MAG TPA: hypothetical protein VL727_21270 [Puia sp.]|nr:hypothetical protein [Puia sp.]